MRQRYKDDILLKMPLFAGLEDAVELAVERGEWRTFPKGAVVFTPTSFVPALGVIVEGALEVTRGTLRMDTLRVGDIFGAASLFDRRGRFPATITARTESRVLFLSRELWEETVRTCPDFSMRYIQYLSGRLTFLSERLDALGAGAAADKLLCYIRDRGGRVAGLPATSLAATLGVSRATLYRALEVLEEKGLLTKEGKTITLTDLPERL